MDNHKERELMNYGSEKQAKYYLAKFKVWENGERRVNNQETKRTKKLPKSIKFVQCYDKSVPARKHLPRYLFLAPTGEVLSFQDTKAEYPTLKKLECYPGTTRPKVRIAPRKRPTRGKKDIPLYDLTAIVFGSTVFGKTAKKALEEKDYMAFGQGELDLQGHHIEKYSDEKTLAENVDPQNIQIVTNRLHHSILEAPVPDINASTEEHEKFIDKLLSELENELDPNEGAIFLTGSMLTSDGLINSQKASINYLDAEKEWLVIGLNLLPENTDISKIMQNVKKMKENAELMKQPMVAEVIKDHYVVVAHPTPEDINAILEEAMHNPGLFKMLQKLNFV